MYLFENAQCEPNRIPDNIRAKIFNNLRSLTLRRSFAKEDNTRRDNKSIVHSYSFQDFQDPELKK